MGDGELLASRLAQPVLPTEARNEQRNRNRERKGRKRTARIGTVPSHSIIVAVNALVAPDTCEGDLVGGGDGGTLKLRRSADKLGERGEGTEGRDDSLFFVLHNLFILLSTFVGGDTGTPLRRRRRACHSH